ncbi:TolC family type I secretion outer membrane protein [Variovorax paradoxus]|uniref:TolC family outer membrane protein n=1 Tax=Variovorax TaxID=34072 RepID=UPI00177BC20F|nr:MULTISPECIES: TolC family outer membrane protein [Variovorax]MBD9663067.1 TolC family outer membrane protein [Variovorax sp. VRV01]MDP9963141.1 TolC family type I secretion outer membrane protein [Variovorax paradoxus]
MKVKKHLLAFAAAAGLLCGPAWSLDLSQAYGEALAQDSTIRAVRAATDARRERLPQARAQLLPNLSASVSRYRNWLERTSPDASGQLVTANLRYTSSSEALTLRQPLFRMYQMADYRQAQAQVDDAEATLERETQNVGVRVSGAYFEALLAEEHLALVLAQKTAYTTQFDAAQKRLGAGFGTRTDIDEARAALDLNLAQELEARQNLDFTRRQIQSLVNRPIDRLAPLDSSRMRLVRPSPDRLEDWVEQAEINSPELQSLVAQVEAARYELEKAQAGHYPTLDAIAQWSRNDSDTINNIKTRYSNKSIGLQLSIPLYSGGHVSSTVRQAIAGQQRAEEALEALRRDLGVRLHREFRGVTEGVLRVRALEQAVRSAEQVVISNRRSFEAGSRTLPDVLNAEQQKVSAQRDLAQARFVYLMSRIRLQALAGGAKAEVIDEVNGWLVR